MGTNRTTRAGLYARVSTTDQNSTIQLEALGDYAKARQLEVVGDYLDHGVSGARAKRPALDRLVTDARKRKLDVVVVIKLDRLARSVQHLVNLAAEWEALGVDLVVIDQAIDTTTPAGKLLFHVLSAISEFERELIRERTRAGLAAAKRRGATLGRPRALDKTKRDRVVRLRSSGKSLREIARLVGVSKSSVANALAHR